MILSPFHLFLLIDVLLAIAIAAAFVDGNPGWSEPVAIAPDPASLAPLEIARRPPNAEVLRAAIERPLFARNRRPQSADAAASTESAQSSGDPFDGFVLVGLAGSGGDGVVVVRSNGANKRIRVGGRLGDWTVNGIDGRTVHLARGESETRELHLDHARQRSATRTSVSGKGASAPLPPDAELRAPDSKPQSDPSPPPATPAAARPSTAPAATNAALSVEERIAERRARREAMRARVEAQ